MTRSASAAPSNILSPALRSLCGGALDARVFDGLERLVRDQIMSMKTTFTPGHYRRRVAGVLARRLLMRLFEEPTPAAGSAESCLGRCGADPAARRSSGDISTVPRAPSRAAAALRTAVRRRHSRS